MKIIACSQIAVSHLPGRDIQKAVGLDSSSWSNKMTVGFAHYSAQIGPMEPHHHAEETVFIIDVSNGWVEFGEDKDNLKERVPLEKGMILHIPEMEWHAFRCGQDGYVDIIFIYGQTDNIRPEEKR
jgi:mannose-6-phosphate isomerase-like protein (cupin superfamily)